jgi:hypothetical protein
MRAASSVRGVSFGGVHGSSVARVAVLLLAVG